MTLSQKEQGLLSDLKSQEELCIEKYGKYAAEACDGELKNLFTQLGQNEQKHLSWITSMQSGTVPDTGSAQNGGKQNAAQAQGGGGGGCADAYLCRDALAMEKHVSSVYDVSIFEFCDEGMRQVLNKIQGEEQHHGEQIYKYMSAHGMYC